MYRTAVSLYKDDPNRFWNGAGGSGISDCPKYIRAVQGEAGSEVLEFHLMQSPSVPLDLTGDAVTFYMTKPDGQQIFLNADVPAATAAQGIAAVTLTAQCTAAAGIARHGEIRVTANDNSVLKFPVPDLYIQGSDTENAVESTSEFHALDIALNSANKALQNAQSAYDSAQSMLDSDRQAVSDATGAAVNANSKADSASKAAADASNSASAANTASKAANDSATAANNAAQSASAAANSATSAATAANSAVANMAAAAKAEVEKHASRTDNPHKVTAAQIGAASNSVAILDLQPVDGTQLGDNKICRVIITDTVKIVGAELVSTKALPAGTQLLQLPNLKYGYLPKAIFVNQAFCYAWIYGDGSLKTLQDIPANAEIVINIAYI